MFVLWIEAAEQLDYNMRRTVEVGSNWVQQSSVTIDCGAISTKKKHKLKEQVNKQENENRMREKTQNIKGSFASQISYTSTPNIFSSSYCHDCLRYP